jgi:hypothetical protein
MTQETTQVGLDDEDQLTQALADIRADRSEELIVAVQAEPIINSVPTFSEPLAAPESVKAAIQPDTNEQLKQAQADLHKARSEIGRVDALNRKYMQAAHEAAQLREELAQSRLAPQQRAATPDAASKLAEVAEQVKDFPELAGIVAAVSDALKQADMKTEEVARRVAAQVIEPLEPLRREQTSRIQSEQKAAYDAAMATFNSTYPTAVQVVQSDDFKEWLGNQPGNVQYAFAKGETPSEAMAVLDTYDMHLRRNGLTPVAQFNQSQNPPQTRSSANTNRLQRAAGIPSRSSGQQGGQPPSDDFDGALAYFRNKRLASARVSA